MGCMIFIAKKRQCQPDILMLNRNLFYDLLITLQFRVKINLDFHSLGRKVPTYILYLHERAIEKFHLPFLFIA